MTDELLESPVSELVRTEKREDGDDFAQRWASTKARIAVLQAEIDELNEKRRGEFIRQLDQIYVEEQLATVSFGGRRDAIYAAMREADLEPPTDVPTAVDAKIGNGIARRIYDALNASARKCLHSSALNNFLNFDRQMSIQAIKARPDLFSSGGGGQGAWISLKGHEDFGNGSHTPSQRAEFP